MWYFYSPVATFTISPDPSGGYTLWSDNDQLNTYIGPAAAVEAVRIHKTGFTAWDERPDLEGPADLSLWFRVK